MKTPRIKPLALPAKPARRRFSPQRHWRHVKVLDLFRGWRRDGRDTDLRGMRRVLFVAFVAVCLALVSPGGPGPVEASAAGGRGERWDRVVVDLSDQWVTVFNREGAVLRSWPASTGAKATPTPVGRFRVTTKSASTFVRDDPSVTMRFMTRFRGGVGFHGIPRDNGRPMKTPLGVKGVSHGCVRLADANARELFQKLPLGAVVVVQA